MARQSKAKPKTICRDIYLDAQLFFTDLGYKSWKGAKTRVSNKLGIPLRETLTPDQIKLILELLSSTASIARKKAQQYLQLMIDNPPENTVEESEKVETLEIPKELLEKYNLTNLEDIVMKYNIILKEDDIFEAIEKRKKTYKFEYDRKIVMLLEEMLLKEMI